MNFSIYLPSSHETATDKLPVLYFLAGLTSSDENSRTKSFLPFFAEQHQIAVVFPDTSPRDIDASIPELKEHDWQKGYGAGFYVDATK